MMPDQLWSQLHDLFDTDDGSLPEIWLTNLSGPQVGQAYSFFRSLGKEIPRDSTFWDKLLQQARAIDSVENAATLVAQGTAEPFHVLVCGPTLQGISIPDLGIFVDTDRIYLDYRQGPDWGPAELATLFECLHQLKQHIPEMQVALHEYVIEQVQRRFQQAWQQYLREKEH